MLSKAFYQEKRRIPVLWWFQVLLRVLDTYICWYMSTGTYTLGGDHTTIPSCLLDLHAHSQSKRAMRKSDQWDWSPFLANKWSLFRNMIPSTSHLTSVTLKHVGSEDTVSTPLPPPVVYPPSPPASYWSSHTSFTSFSSFWVFQIMLLCLVPFSLPPPLSYRLWMWSFVFMISTLHLSRLLFTCVPVLLLAPNCTLAHWHWLPQRLIFFICNRHSYLLPTY